MARRIVHLRDIRLYNNVGMAFPVCKVTDRGECNAGSERFTLTGHYAEVTCTRCKVVAKRRYRWAFGEEKL